MKAEFSLVIFLDIEIMKEYSNYVQCRIASTVNSVIMFRNVKFWYKENVLFSIQEGVNKVCVNKKNPTYNDKTGISTKTPCL